MPLMMEITLIIQVFKHLMAHHKSVILLFVNVSLLITQSMTGTGGLMRTKLQKDINVVFWKTYKETILIKINRKFSISMFKTSKILKNFKMNTFLRKTYQIGHHLNNYLTIRSMIKVHCRVSIEIVLATLKWQV